MVADVVGYSRLVAEDEAHALSRVRSLRRQVVEPRITAHAGRPFAALGDSFLAEFPSAVEAVACAVSVQRELSIGAFSSLGLTLRIGIAIGDVMVDSTGDVFGDSVNVAARLQTLAEPGGIAISGKTFDELRGRLPYPFADGGQQTLKNITAPVSMFTLNAAAIGELSVPTAITPQRPPRGLQVLP
jgi:adenylate cyclase